MNKAFVRESDAPPPRCPERVGCGQPGLPVPAETRQALLDPIDAARLAPEAFYCPNPACAVAYFDAWGGVVDRDSLRERTWPKDPDGLVCGCLRLTVADLVADARAGRRETVLAVIAVARSAEARCGRCMPDGRSCEREVRRLFQNPGLGEPRD